jgi:hypothetical protein
MEIPIPFYLDLFSKKNDLGIDKNLKNNIFAPNKSFIKQK